MYCHFHGKSGKSECPLQKRDLRTNEQKVPFFFLPSALLFGACQFDTEKSHLATWEHVQNGPKLKY